MLKNINKVIDIVVFAARLEREDIPLTLEERKLLADATFDFAEAVKPLYEKYGVNHGECEIRNNVRSSNESL